MTPEEKEQHDEYNAVFFEVHCYMKNAIEWGSPHQKAAASAILWVLGYYESGQAPEILDAISQYSRSQQAKTMLPALPPHATKTA